jgi:hypothetical protein
LVAFDLLVHGTLQNPGCGFVYNTQGLDDSYTEDRMITFERKRKLAIMGE